MPELNTILLLAAAALALQLTPGPDMILVMGRGVGQGYRIAQATAFGIASAGLIQLPLLAFGLSTFVTSEPWILDFIRLLGAAYLGYIGIKLICAKSEYRAEVKPINTTVSRAILDGAVANLFNPKLIVFQLAFIPQFIDTSVGPVWSQMLILGFVMKACGFLVMSTVAFSSGAASRLMTRYPIWPVIQNKIVGIVMVSIGVKLLFDLGSDTRQVST